MTLTPELKNPEGLKCLNGFITAKWYCWKVYSTDSGHQDLIFGFSD